MIDSFLPDGDSKVLIPPLIIPASSIEALKNVSEILSEIYGLCHALGINWRATKEEQGYAKKDNE